MTRGSRGALLLVLALAAGCGDEPRSTSPRVETPAGTRTTEPAGDAWVEIAIVTGTAAGGEVSNEPARVDTQAALDAFVAQFERSDLADKVLGAVSGAVSGAGMPEGWVPVAAVISIGCDVPPGVVVDTAGGLSVTGQKVAEPLPECFAAMTSVAVLAVDPAVL